MSEQDFEQQAIELRRKLVSWNNFRRGSLSKLNHDARGPLTSIFGFAELLEDDSSANDTLKQYARRIIESAEKLETLLDDFRDELKDYPPDPTLS